MLIEIDEIRKQHKKARTAFFNSRNQQFDSKRHFISEYEKEYNLTVVAEWINHFGDEYPRAKALEFVHEKDYVWFMLRFS
jgi:hypothetical protein